MRMYTDDFAACNKRLWAVWSDICHDVCFVSPLISNCRAYIRASGNGPQYAVIRFDVSRFSLGKCLGNANNNKKRK